MSNNITIVIENMPEGLEQYIEKMNKVIKQDFPGLQIDIRDTVTIDCKKHPPKLTASLIGLAFTLYHTEIEKKQKKGN